MNVSDSQHRPQHHTQLERCWMVVLGGGAGIADKKVSPARATYGRRLGAKPLPNAAVRRI